MCYPSEREVVVITDQNKVGVLVKTYYKGYSKFWTGRQYVLEYEEINNGV